MAVVCAGPKAILDVPATLEYLETRGVPVVAVGQADLPGFFARSAGLPAPECVPDIAAAATVVATHLELGLGGAILVCVPVPEADALPRDLARQAVEAAIADAASAGIGGPALTPWLLARIAVLTDGRVGACQHGAHPQRRPGRGRAGGAAGRRLTAGRCPRRARHLAARSGARYTRGRPGRGPLTRGGTDHDADL